MSQRGGTRAEDDFSRYMWSFPQASAWLERSEAEREQLGYQHTLSEILQQPETWIQTAEQVSSYVGKLQSLLEGSTFLVLTGSGSSEYAGECVRLPLQKALRLPVQSIGSGAVLTNGSALLPETAGVMVSFARSGDSPESVAALHLAQKLNANIRHLIVTCNEDGRLSRSAAEDETLEAMVLDPRTNDRSLVMTSSFTNMALASLVLAFLQTPQEFVQRAQQLSKTCGDLLRTALERFPAFVEERFERAFYLASPSLFGAARETALKMTEMTAGRVITVCETYLGLRHGPMSAVHSDSLVVCYLSANPLIRAYELDVIRELNEKQLGMKKLFIGSDIPADIAGPRDLIVDLAGFDHDDSTAILYVVAGQVLALLRCLQEGLRPDAPSEDGVINRVVGEFRIYDVEEVLVP